MTTKPTPKKRTTSHDTFRIERVLTAPPERVFRAWSDPELKARWFAGTAGEWTEEIRSMDFRVGGCDRLRGTWHAKAADAVGHTHSTSDFLSRYVDIVPNERIVYFYEMQVDEARISASLATIEISPHASGTRMVVTEQGVFLDYEDGGSRERGTAWLLDKLAASLG